MFTLGRFGLPFLLLIIRLNPVFAQNFINGDFENNTALVDQINLSNPAFNGFMNNSNGFGSFPNLDIITSSTYGAGPQNGQWHVALTGGGTDMLAMQLTTALVPGNSYTITFYDMAWFNFVSSPIEVGLSAVNNAFGTLIYTTPAGAVNSIWTPRNFSFIAPSNGHWIVIRQQGALMHWVQVDHFSFDTCATNSLNLGPDSSLCAGDSMILNVSQPNATYVWQDNSTDSIYVVKQSGLYYVTIADSCGFHSDSLNVIIVNLPVLNLGNDTTLCAGDSLLLDATQPNVTWLWQDNSTDSTFLVKSAGTYHVTVSNSCFGPADTIVISFAIPLVINLGNDTSICSGDTIILNASHANSIYLWQNNLNTASVEVFQPGLFWVNVTDAYGCQETDSINITVIPFPTVNLGNDTILCTGDILILNASFPGATCLWQDSSINSLFNVFQPGTFSVDVFNSCGVAGDKIIINYMGPPAVSIGNDSNICAGNTVEYSAAYPGATYSWQDNSNGPTFTAFASGNYSVTVSNGCGSVSDTTVLNVIQPPQADLGADRLLCEGDSISLNASWGNSSYLWSDNSIASTLLIRIAGTYWVTLTDTCGMVSDTIFIEEDPLPDVNLSNDTLMCDGDVLILQAGNPGATYSWHNSFTGSDFTVSRTDLIWVDVTNHCGKRSDSILVEFKNCDCKLFIPDAFTPDGDGLNDEFDLVYTCSFSEYDLKIFDRWGMLVYQTLDANDRWNAEFQGKGLPEGVYVFVLMYRFQEEENRYSINGDITILR